MSPQITFTYSNLEHKLSSRLTTALRFIGSISQEDVTKCGNTCLTEIIRQYIIAPPILRFDLMNVDDSVIEAVDITFERKTGHTHHSFFIPIERDCEWFDDISSQKIGSENIPLAFLDKQYCCLDIRLSIFPDDEEGELKRRLDERLEVIKKYTDSITELVINFNKDLAKRMSVELNKRKIALIQGRKRIRKHWPS